MKKSINLYMKIGVLGAGHLGKIHIKLLQKIEEFELIGFYDPNKEVAKEVSLAYNVKAFDSKDELFDEIDAVDIVTSTISHFELAVEALERKKHVFVEKPLTQSVEEAKILSSLRKEAGTRVQVGHVERFNPAFISAEEHINSPMFIECHRLAQFNPRGTDVSVVLDLMIHDLDVLLNMVNSEVVNVHASGVSIMSKTPDICNARVEFENGCVANITASRISLKNMRKMRIFQNDAYISIDFLDKSTEIIKIKDLKEGEEENPFGLYLENPDLNLKREVQSFSLSCEETNAIFDELKSFYTAIINDKTPIVSLTDGMKALALAKQISEKIK